MYLIQFVCIKQEVSIHLTFLIQGIGASGRCYSPVVEAGTQVVLASTVLTNTVFMQNVEELLVKERENLDPFEDRDGNDWDGRSINLV
jgi:hypothetical protein